MSFRLFLKKSILKLKMILNKIPLLKKIVVFMFQLFPPLYNRIRKIKPTPTFTSYKTKKIYFDLKNTLERKSK